MADKPVLTTTAGNPLADYIVERQLTLFDKVHPDCAGVRAALKGQSPSQQAAE